MKDILLVVLLLLMMASLKLAYNTEKKLEKVKTIEIRQGDSLIIRTIKEDSTKLRNYEHL